MYGLDRIVRRTPAAIIHFRTDKVDILIEILRIIFTTFQVILVILRLASSGLCKISSLVQIDQDTAQESIGQLSDLLRYTLYESNHELVPVEGEIEFMNNYIELMRLRCNELATVEVDLQIPIKPMRIVPLLFISLIENAFKHGVNSRKSSFVRIRFKAEGDNLVFTCENSDHPKPDVNRSGSGIGLENLRRRLDLAYPGRYRYDQELRENSYFVQITLRDCL